MNLILKPVKLSVLRQKDYEKLRDENSLMLSLIASKADEAQRARETGVEAVVFSKDRALQLHALIDSYFRYVKDPCKLRVLFSASNPSHRKAYETLFAHYRDRDIHIVEEQDFRKDLLRIIDQVQTSRMIFLVDDIVFKNPVSFESTSNYSTDAFVLSLRLGDHLRSCYTLQKDQPLPPFKKDVTGDPHLLSWKWEDGALDWNYPLSLDGHIFSTREIRLLTQSIFFSNPNSYERHLQQFNPLFLPRFGLCYANSVVMNLPVNKVQDENQNISGNVHQDDLLKQWEQGLSIDYEKFAGYRNQSAHEEMEICFKKRDF